MSNPCKETYNCSQCCKDALITMTLEEFAVFAQAWLHAGAELVYVDRKATLSNFGRHIYEKKRRQLFYSANRTLADHTASGRYGNTQVVAVFAGLCMNNDSETGYCQIQESKPKGCSKFAFNGNECRETREQSKFSRNEFIPLSEII